MNKSQPPQQKPPIPQNPTNNLTTNTITNDNNTKNNRTEIQPSNNTRAMNKSQPSQQKPPIPQKPTNNLTTNTTTNDNNTKNNRTDIQSSNNNKTINKSQPCQQKPQIPQKPTLNHTATITNDKNPKNNRTDIKPNNNNNSNNKVIWDCGSSLYDSFELDSFRKQIDSAIINSARTLSMPRLPSENNRAPPPQQPLKKQPSSKFSRSFQKLIRSVFRGSKSDKKVGNSGNSSPDPWFFDSPVSCEEEEKDGKKVDGGGKYFIVYDKPEVVNGLTTIPEVPEVNYSPEIGSNLVRKTMSERFTSASFGIHCA